jgi:hypothetical protein
VAAEVTLSQFTEQLWEEVVFAPVGALGSTLKSLGILESGRTTIDSPCVPIGVQLQHRNVDLSISLEHSSGLENLRPTLIEQPEEATFRRG